MVCGEHGDEDHGELLLRARHRSKRDLDRLVAEIAPRPDVPSHIRALPQQLGLAEAVGPAEAVGVGLEVRAPERARRAVIAPLSPRRSEIRVTVDEATHEKRRQLQDLLAHTAGRDPAVILAQAIDR